MQLVWCCFVVPPANSNLFPRYTCLSASPGSQARKVSDSLKTNFKIAQSYLVCLYNNAPALAKCI